MKKWNCPHCGSDVGVDICDWVPQYFAAEITEDGVVRYVEGSDEIFYDGAELDAVRCLNCRIELTDVRFENGEPAVGRLEYRL